MELNLQRHLKCWLWRLTKWTQFQLWYNWFKGGREEVNDDARPGRKNASTTDENIEAVRKMILDISRITIWEVADNVGIKLWWTQTIFTHILGMKRAAAILPRRCWRRSTTIQICSKVSQRVTNLGCMAITLKPKANHPNGSF